MSGPSLPPPVAPQRPHVRDLHGEQVADPWFWMRDHADPDLLTYLAAERVFYDRAQAPLGPVRDRIAASLKARLPAQSWGCPWRSGGWVFQTGYAAGAQYPRTLRWPAPPDPGSFDRVGEPQVVLDVAAEAGGAAYAEVGILEVSADGRWLAFSLDHDGDEVYQLRFRDLLTGADLPERIARTYYGGAFTADGSAFYYTVHDEAYRPFQVWRHRLGAPVADDVLVCEEDDRRFELDVRRTRSGDYVLVSALSRATRQELVLDAHDPGAEMRALRARVPGVEDFAEHERAGTGGRWLLVTNEGASEFRLLSADVAQWTARAEVWRELVASRAGHRLERCDAFAGHLVLGWRAAARPFLELWRTGPGGIEGPTSLRHPDPAGTIRLGANKDYGAPGVVVETTSLIEPAHWQLVAFAGGQWSTVHRAEAPGHDPARYTTTRITVPARDGTPIPVTLAFAVGTPTDGAAPGLIWAYGAYESCDWPEFSAALPEWLDHGVVYAQAHVRGGGEGGRTWWDQGHLRAKPTTFTDLVDVADGLAAGGWLVPDGIATRGLSAGGLLQGAVLAMRPDRWCAVVAEVPFVDCVNSMLDDTIPLTVNEWEEWGDPREAGDYAVMRAYTPYENLPAVDPEQPWPALLVTGALHDPRVLVHEPAKWVAKLRTVADPGAVLLFRAETGPGAHTGPAGRFAAMDYEAEVMTFVLAAFGGHGRGRGAR